MFNEPEFIKLIFLLADTQCWLDGLCKEALNQLPLCDKKKFLRKSYSLSVTALAHILERHHYKIPRHPDAGKFHIPLIEILHYIREAHSISPTPLPASLNFQRIIQAEQPIGFDRNGQPTHFITILTDAGGRIITAFPGILQASVAHPAQGA